MMRNAPLVLIGEIHGTVEKPATFVAIACELLRTGRAVNIGLEIQVEAQQRLDRYVASRGTDADRDRLFDTWAWTRPLAQQDGRASEAMFAVVEWVRIQRAQGMPLSLFAFDEWSSKGTQTTRDMLMARNIEKSVSQQSAEATTLVLAGNSHATKKPSIDPSIDASAGSHIRRYPVLAYIMTAEGGSAWRPLRDGVVERKLGECARKSTPPRFDNANEKVPTKIVYIPFGYDGFIDMGCVTASPPVRIKPE